MAESDKPTGRRYSSFKERLWNQPRPRQILERLEQDRAPQILLEAVAGKFAGGEHGEGEILAAVYTDLLRNRNRAIIPRRLEALRATFSKIHQELLEASTSLYDLREWETYRILEYLDWAEFTKKEFRLSESVAGLLMRIVRGEEESCLNTVVQIMLKGYVAGTVSNGEKEQKMRRGPVRSRRVRGRELRST
jgi:hypothetical protein